MLRLARARATGRAASTGRRARASSGCEARGAHWHWPNPKQSSKPPDGRASQGPSAAERQRMPARGQRNLRCASASAAASPAHAPSCAQSRDRGGNSEGQPRTQTHTRNRRGADDPAPQTHPHRLPQTHAQTVAYCTATGRTHACALRNQQRRARSRSKERAQRRHMSAGRAGWKVRAEKAEERILRRRRRLRRRGTALRCRTERRRPLGGER